MGGVGRDSGAGALLRGRRLALSRPAETDRKSRRQSLKGASRRSEIRMATAERLCALSAKAAAQTVTCCDAGASGRLSRFERQRRAMLAGSSPGGGRRHLATPAEQRRCASVSSGSAAGRTDGPNYHGGGAGIFGFGLADSCVRQVLQEGGAGSLQAEDTLSGMVHKIPLDMAVLATRLEPNADAQRSAGACLGSSNQLCSP